MSREKIGRPVARGPVPRDRSVKRIAPDTVARGTGPRDRWVVKSVFLDPGTAGDRPPPYGMREVSVASVARGPVPRDRWVMKGVFLRPQHGGGQAPALRYGDSFRPWPRSARACPSRSFGRQERFPRPRHGGGQAPALRCGGRFFVPHERSLLHKIRPVQNPLTRIILNIRTKSPQIRLIPDNMLMEITMPDFFTKTRPTQ